VGETDSPESVTGVTGCDGLHVTGGDGLPVMGCDGRHACVDFLI